MITKTELDKLVQQYETEDFIKDDPVRFPSRFSGKNDIEIATQKAIQRISKFIYEN